MHNQDQTKTHTPGHENPLHGVYVCNKCGWPFPNPHPSAKHRRAHKKICGTVEGYRRKRNGSDDERVSDDDYKTPGLVLSSFDNDKGSFGIKGKFTRVESDVFSDAVADFPDTLKGSSQNNDFNASDVTPLVANSSNEFQIKNDEIPQNESFEVGNTVGSQDQLSGSTVDPLISSVADSKTEELSIVHGDGFSGLSSDSSLSKAVAVCDISPEINIDAGEDVTGPRLTGGEKESNLKEKDEVKSESDMVEIVESTNNTVGDEAVNPKENKGSEFVSLQPQYEIPPEVNLSIITKEVQVESAHVIESTNSSEVKVLQEKEDVNGSSDPIPVHDDRLGVAYPHSESLKHEEDVSKESSFHFNTSQLGEGSGVLSEDIHAEHCSDFSLGEVATETYQRSDEIGLPMKTEMSENGFSEEHGPDDIHENSQPKSSLVVSSNEYQRDASFQSATDETFDIINVSHHDTTEINDASVDGKVAGANVENDTEVQLNDYQPSDLLQSEVEESSVLYKNNGDDAGETGKIEQCDSTENEIKLHEEHNKSTGVAVDSHEEQATHLLVKTAEDFSIKHTPNSSTNTKPSAQHDSAVEDDSNGEPVQDQGIDTSADSHLATEDLTSKYTAHSSINTKSSAQRVSAVEDNSGGEVSRITAVPLLVQDQSVNNLIKPTSPGTDASVNSSSRRESLDGNWGSSSVISMISDVPAVIDAETLPPIGSLASSEEGKSDLNTLQAAPADRQLSGKSATFELPSFTTLVEPNHAAANPTGAASENPNPQPLTSTLPAGWFPTLNQVINDSEGRKKNEETIAKITNRSSSTKEHTPLKSLLGEVTHSSKKPKSPKVEETNNVSGLTTVNSILGPESPSAAQAAKEKAADEWNSPARYPANIKREKKKSKSKPFWLQFVCCSTAVDHPQRT